MSVEMTLEDAQKVLVQLGYKKAGGFGVKQAQAKIDEVLEDPDNFESDAKKAKDKEVKKLIDTIWDAVDDEDEIEVVESEEDEDEEDEDSDGDEEDDDEEEEDESEDDEEEEPVKKTGKKGAKAGKSGKAEKQAKRKPPERNVERDDLGVSVNAGAHVINVVLERAKGPMTVAEVTKAAKAVGKELNIKPRPTVGRYLRRLVRLGHAEAEGRGDERTFVLSDGKPRKKSKKDKAEKAESNGKAGKKGNKKKAGKK